jgi:hypothetical protein
MAKLERVERMIEALGELIEKIKSEDIERHGELTDYARGQVGSFRVCRDRLIKILQEEY